MWTMSVMTQYSGSGDPKRSMELLWGAPDRPKRGPKPRLTIDQIVAEAVRIADTEGLGALSMRRVAEELGVSVMSLYTYVPGKSELIDVMLDRASGEPELDVDPDAGWRAGLEAIARRQWRLYHAHPWMLQVSISRPVLGPNVTAVYDHDLRVIDGIGLTDVEMDSVVTLIAAFVQGMARGSVEAAQAERVTGVSDLEWWQEYAPLLEQYVDAETYPTGTRVGAAAGEAYQTAYPADHAFEFGLRRVLDGIAVLVERRGPQ